MQFGEGNLLYLIFLLGPALIVFYLWSFRQKDKALAAFGELSLVKRLMPEVSRKRQKTKAGLIILGTILLILTFARPQYGVKMGKLKRRGIDLIIALDTSLSMNAQDIKPSRFEKAKHQIKVVVDKLRGDRVGLVIFAGQAFMQCPLTSDYSAFKFLLDSVDTQSIPVPGTAIGEAIRVASKGFPQKEFKYKALLLLTDGEDHASRPVEAAEEAKKEGVRIFTIGIGSPQGEPIPIFDEQGNITGYKKDKKGEVVMSKLAESTLQKIALVTNGKYYRATPQEFELDKIYDEISGMEKKELESKMFSQYEERFQYPLLGVLLLLIGEFFLPERIKKV